METKLKLPQHLVKGGNIPLGIAPLYHYIPKLKTMQPFETIDKQPRTLKYSIDFDYKLQLKSQFPDLQSILSDKYRFSNHLELKQNNMNDILTPYNLYQTTKIFCPSYWSFGGNAFKYSDIPSSGDMMLTDSFKEICIAGQSNSGKSSLINVLMGSADFHQGLAVVSKIAGRTRMMNFYCMNFHFCLVDLMGYGFVQNVDKKIRQYWINFMKKYFETRLLTHLEHVFITIDIDSFITKDKKFGDDHDYSILSPNDHEMLKFLDSCYVPYSLILNKIDCINDKNYIENENGTRIYNNNNVNDCSKFEQILNNIIPIFEEYAMIAPFINITSSRLGFGIIELQCIMAYLTKLFEKENINNYDFANLDISDIVNKL